MSPSVSRRRRSGRQRRPPRRRDRRPQRPAISAVIMSAISPRMPAIRFALVVAVAWSIPTGTYFAFRDDVLMLPATEMQITYEDHIADLRTQVDRIISRQFLDQEEVEQQLNGLLQRQATLEQRASALTGDLSATRPMNPTPIVPPVAAVKALPSPINDTVAAPPDQEAAGTLARVSLSLDKIERKQAAALSDLEERIDTRARNMRSVLADLGVAIAKTPGNSATGGPWVPMKPPQPSADAFERQLDRINMARLQIDDYAHALLAVPVRKPVIGDVETSSPFGVRRDPFLGRPAYQYRYRPARRCRRTRTRHCDGQRDNLRPSGRLRQHGGDRPRQRPGHPLWPFIRDRREGRPDRAYWRSRRQDRLDRPFYRPASPL